MGTIFGKMNNLHALNFLYDAQETILENIKMESCGANLLWLIM